MAKKINPSVFLAAVLLCVSFGMFLNRFSGRGGGNFTMRGVIGGGVSGTEGGNDSSGLRLEKPAKPLSSSPSSSSDASAKQLNQQQQRQQQEAAALAALTPKGRNDANGFYIEPILHIERPAILNAFLVEEREGDICDSSSTTASSLPKPATKLADGSLLPDCPPTNPNDSSDAIAAFANQCNLRDHKSWPMLNKKVGDRVNIKALKLLLAARGCDETLEPENKAIREELWDIVANEHNNELTVLEIGSGCGHTLEWLTTYLMGPNATAQLPSASVADAPKSAAASTSSTKRKHPRFNILSVDGSEASIRYIAETVDAKVGSYPTTSPHMLKDEKLQQPSSIKFCQADPIRDALTVGLTWSPSETFNLVFVMDQLNNVPSPAHVCPLIKEMLRVTKVGGAVWAGHIDNKEVIKAISECRISDCVASAVTDGTTPSYGVEMTMLKESFFFGSPRFLTPKQLLEKKPVGVMWRKVPKN